MIADSKPNMQTPPRTVSGRDPSDALAGTYSAWWLLVELHRLHGHFVALCRGDGDHDAVDDASRKAD